MKIAVASDNGRVAEHFGYCQGFMIFEEVNGSLKQEAVSNPGHRPGFLPNYLNDLGVKAIIAGGMGGGAIEIFNEKGIDVVTGARGSAEGAARQYMEGSLQSSGSVCHEHKHHEECQE